MVLATLTIGSRSKANDVIVALHVQSVVSLDAALRVFVLLDMQCQQVLSIKSELIVEKRSQTHNLPLL